MAKEAYMLTEKKRVMMTILSKINHATFAEDKVLSLKKLRAESAMQLGISGKKFDEYIQNFVDMGKASIDGDDLIAVKTNGE